VSDQINFQRLPLVMQRTGLHRSTIYKLMLQDLFPRPIPIVGRHVAWLESTIDTYNRLIVERASEEMIKTFVRSVAVPPEPERKRTRPKPTSRKQSVERIRARA
jgi:prophage regulatory protein